MDANEQRARDDEGCLIFPPARNHPMTPKVWNKHHSNAPADAVYIGRGSPWGNPFVIGKHGDRGQVIQQYAALLHSDPNNIAAVKRELRGKHLVCFCAPVPCHGDVLLRIANET